MSGGAPVAAQHQPVAAQHQHEPRQAECSGSGSASGAYGQHLQAPLMHAPPQPRTAQHAQLGDSFDYRLHIRSASASELHVHGGLGLPSALPQGVTQGWSQGAAHAAPQPLEQLMTPLNAARMAQLTAVRLAPMRAQGPELDRDGPLSAVSHAAQCLPYDWGLDE